MTKNHLLTKSILIIIPARYASSRLPGKPLIKIAGKEMLLRVAEIAISICSYNIDCGYLVATDDKRIEDFCREYNLPVAMTSSDCKNGSERCKDALNSLNLTPQLIINLQGDNPFCPTWVIQGLINSWKRFDADVYTPFVKLRWEQYDKLIQAKKTTPYSGTTVLIDKNGYALSFSKNIIPAIRNKEKAMSLFPISPISKHIGLYAYTYNALNEFNELEHSTYEMSCVEGLEQMRFLYNGYRIKMVEVDYENKEVPSGVDSAEDLKRAEDYIKKYGEIF